MYTVCDVVSSWLLFTIEKLLVIGFDFLAKLRRFCTNFTRILVWKQWKHEVYECLHTSSLAAVHITSYLMSWNVCPCMVIDVCYMPTVPGIGHCTPLKRLAQSKDVYEITPCPFRTSSTLFPEYNHHCCCGKKQTQSLRSSTQLCWCPSKMCSHSDVPKDRPLHSCWWPQSGSCFSQRQNLDWFYTHISASPICFLWSWGETVSLNCV